MYEWASISSLGRITYDFFSDIFCGTPEATIYVWLTARHRASFFNALFHFQTLLLKKNTKQELQTKIPTTTTLLQYVVFDMLLMLRNIQFFMWEKQLTEHFVAKKLFLTFGAQSS